MSTVWKKKKKKKKKFAIAIDMQIQAKLLKLHKLLIEEQHTSAIKFEYGKTWKFPSFS